ncbi:hypothetical protein PISMIDRAFT_265102 [Pisolithus microcarpus 441]|uniref:Uncharacterized protein n=1 Tax=Pisolithus microcarpus 441 TaxID=765257 RepID=A0A0C9ZBK1_9AGAM|nr:hypothetical protein PISMIDRAFT_265102 [Pisolithus microcarpus 441]
MSLAFGSAVNVNLEELDSPSLESIQAELNNWQHITFYGEMSGSSESNDSSNDQNNRLPLSAPSSSTVASAHDDRTASNNVRTYSTIRFTQELRELTMMNVCSSWSGSATTDQQQSLLAAATGSHPTDHP